MHGEEQECEEGKDNELYATEEAQLKAEQRSFLRTLREKVTEQSPQLLSLSLPSALCPLVPKTTGHLG